MSAFARPAPASHRTHGRRLGRLPLLLLVGGLAVALSAVGAVHPAPALGLSTFATRCDGVTLRSKPSTTATTLATLSKGIKVVAVDKVSGGSWRTTCAGTTATGSSWYKITVANGKDAPTRFGLSAVYGASSLFQKLYSMSYKFTACDGVNVRTSSSTAARSKATLVTGTKVTVVGTVSGGKWSVTCGGSGVSGTSWYKINQVNGTSTSSLYGVGAVYAATGLFKTVSSVSPTGKSVRVTSIRALLSSLADNSVGEIVVANGRYHVSPAGQKKADSLWIGGDRFASRTRPILVRAETRGGVTFDGGGVAPFGALSFEDGAHHQTWDGFRFANMKAEYTGIIEVGGYLPRRPPHNITIRNMTITSTCTGRATTADGKTWDHGVYLAHATGVGPHDIRIENLKVDGRGHLASAVHVDHGDATNPPAWNVTVRGLHVIGTQQAVILWSNRLRNWVFDGADIRDAKAHAVRFESSGASGIVFKNMTSSGSGYSGFYSSMGSKPSGVTFSNNSLR
ncbi:MAG TPA: SH3 domain-containing protein [Candidatus Limnocylindrales bacterium]|nr:SH3 domain-containing protein [Candidatus Limnocylindrales bacterium]